MGEAEFLAAIDLDAERSSIEGEVRMLSIFCSLAGKR